MQVARYVETGGSEGIGRANISMPPRHGKSLAASKLFPPWFVGRNPDSRVMLISYGQDLSDKHSRAARNFMRSPLYNTVFPGIQLAQDSSAVKSWAIQSHEGGMDALGIDGAMTGLGAHILVTDDLYKNRAEAESLYLRDKHWEAFTDDVYTRLEPSGAIINIGTRWVQDDHIGRCNERMAHEGWYNLVLPAIAGINDSLGRAEGEALWPDRYPIANLLNIKETLGTYSFSAEYQQSPLPSGGGLFKPERIEIIDHVPDCTQIVRFYDLAVTAKRSADYTAAPLLGVMADETLVILDLYHVQKEFTDVHEGIVQNALMDGRGVRFRLEAEKAGIIGLQYLLRDSRLRGYTFDTKAPEGDKYTRALPFAARVEAGKVKMVRGKWNRALLDELAVFPSGSHDDIVDGLSGANDMLSKPRASFDKVLQVNL